VRIFEQFHDKFIRGSRATRLASYISSVLPPHAKIIEVGSGSGELASILQSANKGMSITGIDILIRDHCFIDTVKFDGTTIPFDDNWFDVALCSDVLHHTNNPIILLKEMNRVARNCVVLKDHFLEGMFAYQTLKFMDRIGNARYGVDIPCNYLTKAQWNDVFSTSELYVDRLLSPLVLYPPIIGWPFNRELHFLARLKKQK
jgi:SAM-dependent methyltransferase